MLTSLWTKVTVHPCLVHCLLRAVLPRAVKMKNSLTNRIWHRRDDNELLKRLLTWVVWIPTPIHLLVHTHIWVLIGTIYIKLFGAPLTRMTWIRVWLDWSLNALSMLTCWEISLTHSFSLVKIHQPVTRIRSESEWATGCFFRNNNVLLTKNNKHIQAFLNAPCECMLFRESGYRLTPTKAKITGETGGNSRTLSTRFHSAQREPTDRHPLKRCSFFPTWSMFP